MAKFHLPTIEEENLKRWEERDIFGKVTSRPATRGNFVFFEGPPTANGKPGLHHVFGRSFKDVIVRYRTMRGYHIDRKAGWDTHGLPVELEVEKQLGFTKKQDIEDYGIAKFNEKCRESVWKYLDLWEKLTRRVGYWIDLEHPYITYKNDYIESLWWVLKEIDKKGLLYLGHRITPHCPRCVTSLSSHELAQGYKDVDDQSIYVKFRLAGEANRYFLVWTTTPWTLPGNDALAVGADFEYVEVRLKATGEQLILAKSRLVVIDGEYEIVGEKVGRDLVGMAYEPLYQTAAAFVAEADKARLAKAYKVYAGSFVSTADGSGIVHIAPAFGLEDAELGEQNGLPTLLTVDPTGMMLADAPGKGKFVKKADEDVKADLTARGLLYKVETYRHSYPFCWRCGTPLIYYAKRSWYIAMSKLRGELQQGNEQINWVPAHIKEGRFGEWLKDIKDWALSRERYWGTPLPVWRCQNGHQQTVGGRADIQALARPANRYFLQRHGESEINVAGIVSSWPEKEPGHLTEKGREQVREAAKRLKGAGVTHIYSSDILRTKETAEIIAAELGLPVVFDARLHEFDFGEHNGEKAHAYHAQWADKMERFEKPSAGGESLRDCRRRMVGFVKELETKHEGATILLVTHGDPMWMLDTGLREVSDADSFSDEFENHEGQTVELKFEPRLPRDEQGHVDLHRPYVDDIALKCPTCGEAMKREREVIDVWFDSGAMPFAQWHYPFENKERIDEGTNFPADYIAEAIDQTRGWFYTLLAVSTLLGKGAPYKNVICHGHLLDSKGLKMSKSKGNIVDPWMLFDKYGADAARWYFFTVNQPGDVKMFDEKSLDEITKKIFLILWNVLSFWKMFAGEGRAVDEVPEVGHPLDLWVLARLAELERETRGGLETYNVVDACRSIGAFVDELSTWYVRRSRDRFKSSDMGTKDDAVATLGYVLRSLSKIMAPFTPFLAEELYKETGGQLESVHLAEWPEGAGKADPQVIALMDYVRAASSSGLEARAAAGIPVRQALAKATVRSPQAFEKWMKGIVQNELNVEAVETVVVPEAKSAGVELDTVITPELKRKGAAREIVRHVNDLRKGAGLSIGDRIKLSYDTDSEFWKSVFAEHAASIASDTLANAVEIGRSENTNSREIETDNGKLWVGIEKL